MNVPFHSLSSFNVNVFPVSSPPANNFIVTLSVLFPSWSSASYHVFSTGISILAGVCVFVTTNPVVAVPVIATSYPSGTVLSFIVYTISVPAFFWSKSVNVPFHSLSSFSVNVFPVSPPSANNSIVTLSVLFPSWSSASYHVFSTGISILAGVCVFVTTNPVVAVPVIATSYPSGTVLSFIVYTISVPAFFWSKSVNVPFHSLSSFSVNVFPVSPPSANNSIVTLPGLIPSWFSASSHVFSTGISILAGSCEFIITNPSTISPAISGV